MRFENNSHSVRRVFSVPLLVLIAGFSASCSSLSFKTYHPDYFREEENCSKGILEQEKNLQTLAFYSHYRSQFFQNASTEQDILIAGDSIAALFLPSLSENLLPGLRVLNRGIPGDTTYLFLLRLNEDILVHRPKIIMLSIGGNDLILGRCFSEIHKNLIYIISAINAELPETRILIVSVPPVNVKELNAVSPFFNQRTASLVSQFRNVYFFDLWPALSEEDRPFLKKEYRIIRPDGKTDAVHFNEEGYRKWAEMFLNSEHYRYLKKNK